MCINGCDFDDVADAYVGSYALIVSDAWFVVFVVKIILTLVWSVITSAKEVIYLSDFVCVLAR